MALFEQEQPFGGKALGIGRGIGTVFARTHEHEILSSHGLGMDPRRLHGEGHDSGIEPPGARMHVGAAKRLFDGDLFLLWRGGVHGGPRALELTIGYGTTREFSDTRLALSLRLSHGPVAIRVKRLERHAPDGTCTRAVVRN